MEFPNFLGRKITLILIMILATALYITYITATEIQKKPNNTDILETKVGDFNVTSIKMNETQILWEGLTTDFKPNTTVKMNGKVTFKDDVYNLPSWNYTTNIYGLRSNKKGKNPAAIDESNFIVLIIGSSNTLGHNVKYQNTYPAKLEKKLHNTHTNPEVINAGIDLTGIIDYYLLFTTLGPKINPDVVILGDMDYTKPISRTGKKKIKQRIWDRIKKKKDKLENPEILSKKIGVKIITRYIKSKNLFEKTRFTKYGKKIQKFAEKRNIKLYFHCNKECPPGLKNWTTKNNASLITQPETFKINPETQYRYPDTHLNKKGHATVAQNIYKSINWTANSSKLKK